MPLFDKNLAGHALAASNYGFSAIRIEDLGAAEYTLVTIVADVSPSTHGFRAAMEATVAEVIAACGASPRRNNLLVRLMAFASDVAEVHGFRPLADCKPGDYDGVLTSLRGTTALFDATVNGVEATAAYGQKLMNNGYDVNGIVVVLSDGGDNDSTLTMRECKEVFADALNQEKLESLVSILVGVNAKQCRKLLDDFASTVGFTQFVDMGNANAKNLSRLAAFMSRSISLQSVSLGSGGAAARLTF
jgi:hypothetical protein